jgi:hypothetical protein
MNSDSFFTKGFSHKVCEDYALHDEDIIIISDGCSSSKYSDVGARLLSFAVLQTCKFLKCTTITDKIYDYIKYFLEFHTSPFLKSFNTLMDATFISACINDEYIHIYSRGDGCFFIKYFDSSYDLINLVYPSGCPNYISYDLSLDRKKVYMENIKTGLLQVYINDKLFKETNEDGYSHCAITKDVEFVAVMSDGIHSFTDLNNKSVDYKDVVKELLSFKGFNGQFVERRFQGFERFCKQNNWKHYDDVSLAVLYAGDNK